jgi:hypothetical protein
VLICIIRRSFPNPASAEIMPTGNVIVITVSATCGALPPRRDAQAFGFSDDINNAKSDVLSKASVLIIRCPPREEVISRHVCENMTFSTYKKTVPTVRPAVYGQMTQAGSSPVQRAISEV